MALIFVTLKIKKAMKFIILAIIALGFLSCTTPKTITQENPPMERDILAEERVIGIVHLNESCGALITAQVGNREVILYPNNLDEKFKKEGMKLKFFFLNSSMPIPNGCNAAVRGDLKDVNAVR